MTYTIYKATEKDIDLFFPFFEKSIKTEFPEYTANTRKYFVEEDYSKEALQKSLEEKRSNLFLAIEGDNIVAFMLSTKTYGGVAFGNWIAVGKDYQGHGIGTALLQAWEKQSVEEGAHKLHVWTDARNVAFYEQQGFILLGKIPDDYYGADDHFLYKILRKSDERVYLKEFLEKKNMKRVIIVHCWDGYPEYCWYPQTKKELGKKGCNVSVPAMPETGEPKLSLWLPKLQEVVGTPDEALYLIGHSAGCITIMRYLETLSENQKVGGVVFVAGFTDNLGFDELSNFFETPIDFEKIKTKANHFVAIASDNDPFVPLKHADILKKKLGAEVIIKHDMKHFSGEVDNEESCTSLPDVINAIEEMAKN